jgi:KipI family sensor histidine kinase inhibitor
VDDRPLRVGRHFGLGATDLLVECSDPVGLATALREAPGIIDAVPGDGCVLVRGLARLPDVVEPRPAPAREHTVAVVYDGADLDGFGVPVAEVVRRHTAAVYRVAYLGFAPGFAYLDGLDPALRRPRRETPRPVVPALSVGVAGRRCCVYPTASPGGWRLLGRAVGITPFRIDATPPALFAPGDTVRFVEADGPRDEVGGSSAGRLGGAVDVRRDTGPGVDRSSPSSPSLQVLAPGLQTLVVDGGRAGWAHLGVPRSGALDPDALARANALVGNPPAAAGLECLLRGPVLRSPVPLAVTWPGGQRLVRAGEVDLGRLPAGMLRVWVAVAGGLDLPPVLGSRSTDLLGGLGPAPLQRGDRLPLGSPDGTHVAVSAETTGGDTGYAGGDGEARLRVRPGPDGRLLDAVLGSWRVQPASDRAALRLDREVVPRTHREPGRTVGLVAGAVQLPPDGRPVVFLAGHPTTGGYPLVGVIDAADLALAAQLRPGRRVRLVPGVPGAP